MNLTSCELERLWHCDIDICLFTCANRDNFDIVAARTIIGNVDNALEWKQQACTNKLI